MALQDNFNIILNKTEQNKQQKELTKQKEKSFEIYLQEELEQAILCYLLENNEQDILLIKAKHKIINNIIKNNEFYIIKDSKYNNIENIKNYLYLKFDKIANKCLRINKIYNKRIEEEKEKEAEKQVIEILKENEQKQNKIKKKNDTIQNIALILAIIILAPVFFLWGLLGGKKK